MALNKLKGSQPKELRATAADARCSKGYWFAWTCCCPHAPTRVLLPKESACAIVLICVSLISLGPSFLPRLCARRRASPRAKHDACPEKVTKPCYVANQEVFGYSVGSGQSEFSLYLLSQAPLTTRVACHHTKTYAPLPLGDNKINMDLAKSFKSGWQQSKDACKGSHGLCVKSGMTYSPVAIAWGLNGSKLCLE